MNSELKERLKDYYAQGPCDNNKKYRRRVMEVINNLSFQERLDAVQELINEHVTKSDIDSQVNTCDLFRNFDTGVLVHFYGKYKDSCNFAVIDAILYSLCLKKAINDNEKMDFLRPFLTNTNDQIRESTVSYLGQLLDKIIISENVDEALAQEIKEILAGIVQADETDWVRETAKMHLHDI